MAPKFFCTGVSGYIGGDAFAEIAAAHPEWEYRCLARSEATGAAISAAYPQVTIVRGDLDSSDVLEAEARAADVVLHFASADHEGGARALAAGLRSRPESAGAAYLVHTSGTGILCYETIAAGSFGEAGGRVWDDVADVADLTRNLPDDAPHRSIDKIVLAASEGMPDRVKTAIVTPPAIYGVGRGPSKTRSIQIPGLTRCFLERGRGFFVGSGDTRWAYVHVHDLSKAFLLLAEAAVAQREGKGAGKAAFNGDGYYFAEAGELVWGDVSREIARRAHAAGALPTAECESVSAEEASKLHGGGRMLWGAASRSKATRFRDLGWEPKGPSINDTLDGVIKEESESLKRGDKAVQHI